MEYVDRLSNIDKLRHELETEISERVQRWAEIEIRDRVAEAVQQEQLHLKNTIDAFKKDMLKYTLELCGGNRHFTARVLKISRGGLIQMIERYKL